MQPPSPFIQVEGARQEQRVPMPLGQAPRPLPPKSNGQTSNSELEQQPLMFQTPNYPAQGKPVDQFGSRSMDTTRARSLNSEDEDSDEEYDSCCDRCDPCKIILCMCLFLVALVLLVALGGYFYIRAYSKKAFLTTAREAFGTPVQADSVDVGIISARTIVQGVSVANPPGYDGDFMHLRLGVCDTSFWAMTQKVVEIELLALDGFNVSLVQQLSDQNITDVIIKNGKFADPNFVPIMDQLDNSSSSGVEPPDFLGGKVDSRRWIIDRLEMTDLNILMDMRLQVALGDVNLVDPKDLMKLGRYNIPRIVVNSIGRWTGGVSMEELMDIVTRSLVNAAIKAAPANMKRSILGSIRSGVHDLKHLDFDSISADVGMGMEKMEKLFDRLYNEGRSVPPALPVAEPKTKGTKPATSTFTKASQEVDNAMDATADIGDEMAGAMINSTDVWRAVLREGNGEALDRAVNSTAAAFDVALARAGARARNEGGVGADIADALNATQDFATEAGQTADKVDALAQAALTDPTTTGAPVAQSTVITLNLPSTSLALGWPPAVATSTPAAETASDGFFSDSSDGLFS